MHLPLFSQSRLLRMRPQLRGSSEVCGEVMTVRQLTTHHYCPESHVTEMVGSHMEIVRIREG